MTAVWTAAAMAAPAAPTARGHWATEPFVMGSDADFARLREWLVACEFTEAGFARVGGIKSIYEFPPASANRAVFREAVDPQSLLVHLFLDGVPVHPATIDRIFGVDGRARLDALGLLQPAVADPSRLIGTVALLPLEGIYMISDRYGGLEVVGGDTPGDLVYSPITSEAHRFVELMPRQRVGEYLELCSGSGVAALIAANTFAERAWGIDITERSTRFAEFAKRLNGLTNVEFLAGDLYAPVEGQSFDLITAHPPYVASFDNDMIYRDAGEDGEQVTRAIINGLADHLRPGGQFYCDCTMTDRVDAPLERRIREMLGPKHEEFDVIVGQAAVNDPAVLYGKSVSEGRTTPEMFARRLDAFNKLGITNFVSAVFLIQRRATDRPTVTRRRIITGATTAADYQWLVRYLVATSGWTEADLDALLDVTPRVSPHTEWRHRAVVREGQWRPLATQLGTLSPFAMEADCPAWFATLLAWCDGATPARQHLRRLRESGAIPPASPDRQFAQLIRELADGAFIELPAFPLPHATLVGSAPEAP